MREIKNNIYYCGVQDCNRRLFDELIPLPNGTSYNSYLIKGSEKTALVDTSYSKTMQEFVHCLNGDVSAIDYIIANHGEGDHTSALRTLLELAPKALIVTNAKCKEILMDSYEIDEAKFLVVGDKETLSLGDKTLQFHLTPFVHWPDTMFTYVVEDKFLFTCDYLGAHYTFKEGEFYAPETTEYIQGAKRYYAEIMMPFRTHCQKYVTKIEEEIKPEIVAPSHGGVYKNPKFILNAYKTWASDVPKNKVVIPYVSMYGSVKAMAEYLAKKLEGLGVEVELCDIVNGDLGELASALVDSATVVFGASMVLANPHPYAMLGIYIVNALRPNVKFLSIIGSYGWGGNLIGKIEENTNGLKVEKLDYVTIKGAPKTQTYAELDKLAITIAQKHKGL